MKKRIIIICLALILLLSAPLFRDRWAEKPKETIDTVTEFLKEEVLEEENGEPSYIDEETPLPESPAPEKEAYEEPLNKPEYAGEEIETENFTCSLSVRCDSLIENPYKLKEEKRAIVPGDGIIFSAAEVGFTEGESAFDVLRRALIESAVHLEYVKSPMYDSVYIEGIGNLYEFDAGDLSGWLYKVNGEKPNYGCSQYILKNGDNIEFLYTINFMED